MASLSSTPETQTESIFMQQYPTSDIEELDELTYKRFRSETNQSQDYSREDAQRLRALISKLWQVPRSVPGDTVAGTTLLEVVGKGAFGTVWKARVQGSGEYRAVKIFDADRLGDGLAVHLFRRGVRAMKYLREQNRKELSESTDAHPLAKYIVEICDVEPHMLAFSMEWLPGGDLSQGSIRGKTLDAKLELFRHIAKAVEYAHTRPSPIVHRDIKPQNIVMNGDVPILTDFDIADMAFAKTLSRRAVGGAFAYAAPEQLSGECDYLEKRSDIYSLGRLLHYILLERDPPIQIERNPSLEELNAYPEGLVKIIRRCTHRDLPMRYSHVGELLEELDKYEDVEEVGAYGPNQFLAHDHWQRAEEYASSGSWEKALQQGRQAREYMEELDEQQSQNWSYEMLWWRVRAGEWGLFPRFAKVWFQQLSLPVALFLIFLMVSPFSVPVLQAIRSRARQDKLEKAIQQLLTSSSLTTITAQNSLAILKSSQERLDKARKRLVTLFSRSTGKSSCRHLRLLYLLAPSSSKKLYLISARAGKSSESLYEHNIAPFFHNNTTFRWGPAKCQKGVSLPWLRLSNPKEVKQRWFQIQATQADLRFLHAEGVIFAHSNFHRSNLTYAQLSNSQMDGINLSNATLAMAVMKKTKLSRTNSRGTSFVHADMRGVVFNRMMAVSADFRQARLDGANFRYATFQGSVFDHTAVPAMRKGGLDKRSFQHAVCLTSSYFHLKGNVDQCYQWHKNIALKSGKNPSKRPEFCPQTLTVHSIFVAYPPNVLKKEGRCPWQLPEK